MVMSWKQLVGDRIETVERLVYRIQVGLARTGQGQSTVVAEEQGRVQIRLKLTYLLTHRCLGDVQILRRPRETQALTGGFPVGCT